MENETSQITKGLLGFAGIMAVGFIIVATTRESPTDKKMEATYMHDSMLKQLALDKCSEAIYTKTKERVYTPSSTVTETDGVVLTWNASASTKAAECRYVQEKGISSLSYNGQTLISRQ